MKNTEKINKIHSQLNELVKVYVETIKNKYGKYMADMKLQQLNSIEDYSKIIKIFDYGSINGYATDYNVYMPLCADKIFKLMRFVPGYGINKSHKTHNENDLIINDNTYVDYVLHVFLSGSNLKDYYQDMLLHETMHFCGSGGATALKEGINEFLTRKIAYEKGFRTSACGYPKEVKIAYELQKIFGEEIIDQIAFINDENEILRYLDNKLGKDASMLYKNVSMKMEEEFNEKYYKYMDFYNGITGIAKKVLNYNKIDYSNVYELIEQYKNSKVINR